MSSSVKDLLAEAKRDGLRERYDEALPKNQEARRLAQIPEDQIQSRRWEGVCHYYLEDLRASEACLREALNLAEAHDRLDLKLYIHNHLGATLRRLGKLDEALDLLSVGLSAARGAKLISQRCRLLGNVGALWDELGQRERAADAYGRYEELSRLLADRGDEGTQERLANALGLAERAARLRGDLDLAERLGDEAGALLGRYAFFKRKVGYFKHKAELCVARALVARNEPYDVGSEGKAADPEELLAKADRYYSEAMEALDLTSRGSRETSLLLGWSHCALLRGEAALAHQRALRALEISEGLRRPEEIANSCERLARIAQETGLLGEAMVYLERAINKRHDAYERLASPRVRALAQPRLTAIRGLALELAQTAQRVDLSEKERREIEGLCEKVGAEGIDLREDRRPPLDWSQDVREASRARWKLLLGPRFTSSSEATQTDLIRADVVYHGAIDDLGRAAHLLIVVVERELRERFVEPIRAEAIEQRWGKDSDARLIRKKWKHPSLGSMIEILLSLAHPKNSESPFNQHVHPQLRPHADLFAALDGAINQETDVIQGDPFKLRDLRNAVAHGKASIPLNRRVVDAARRRLLLTEDAPLVKLLDPESRWAAP